MFGGPGIPSTDSELRRCYIHFLKERICKLNPPGGNSTLEELTRKRNLYGLLGVARNPSSCFPWVTVDGIRSQIKTYKLPKDDLVGAFEYFTRLILVNIAPLPKLWNLYVYENRTNRNEAEENVGESDEDEENAFVVTSISKRRRTGRSSKRGTDNEEPEMVSGKTSGRPPKDRIAQRIVPEWYGVCPITHLEPHLQGAQILDVKVTKTLDAENKSIEPIWYRLASIWPLGLASQGSLNTAGAESINILPLYSSVRLDWDDHTIAFRPIEHPIDPKHRLYLQILWLIDITEPGNLKRGPEEGHPRFAPFLDRGRENGAFSMVRHGDVYEIVTEDPEKYPLPNVHFLKARFAAQKLLAGMKAAGAIKDMFGGLPPPGIGCPITYEEETDGVWDLILQEAKERGLLSNEAISGWRRYLGLEMYQGEDDFLQKTPMPTGDDEQKGMRPNEGLRTKTDQTVRIYGMELSTASKSQPSPDEENRPLVRREGT